MQLTQKKTALAHADGEFRFACGRQYFISSVALPQLNAYEVCCKYGLKLLSLESLEEVDCIKEMNWGLWFETARSFKISTS